MSTDWRALCAELISALADFKPLNNRELAALDRARAALAEPVGEGVTDEELWTMMPVNLRGDEEDALAFAHAAIAADRAHFGHQPAPPAAEEVRELVAWLRETGDLIQPSHLAEHQRYKRAADLLERQAAPVPVAERLPDTSDPAQCRMPDGDCWWFDPHADGAWYMDTYHSCYTHWLPFHALPLPAGEVEP